MLIDFDYSYFFTFGLFDLLILTYQDIKDGRVDSRFNWYMGGIVGSVVALLHPSIVLVFGLIGFTVFFYVVTNRFLGRGDRHAFNWIILGVGLWSLELLIVWFFFLFLYSSVQFIVRRWFVANGSDISSRVPYYPVIFVAFFTTAIVYFC